MNSIFDRIFEQLRQQKMTVKSLCEKLGIRRSRFYYWLRHSDLPVSYLVRIAEILGVSVCKLLYDERFKIVLVESSPGIEESSQQKTKDGGNAK